MLLLNSTTTCFTGSGGTGGGTGLVFGLGVALGLGAGVGSDDGSGGGTGGATFGIGADDEAFERVEGGDDFCWCCFFRTWCNISLHYHITFLCFFLFTFFLFGVFSGVLFLFIESPSLPTTIDSIGASLCCVFLGLPAGPFGS